MSNQTPIPFNYTNFIADYPQFANVSQSKITNIWTYEACNLGQCVSSLWCDNATQYYWTQIVLCHLLTLENLGQTGRVSSAGQGIDSVGFDFNAPQWGIFWAETVYGQKIIQAMQEFLSGGHYIPSGSPPYNSNSMNGAWELGFYGYI